MNSSTVENLPEDFGLRRAAEKIVANSLGRPVHFTTMDLLTEPDRRCAIYRCFTSPGSQAESTYIIKKVAGAELSAVNHDPRRVMRFHTDWIGAEFLSSIPAQVPVSPRFYGGDPSAGFFVLEDLGEHRSLVEPLLEGDARSAEEALIKYGTCLGRLHAMTAGKIDRYKALSASKLSGPTSYEMLLEELTRRLQNLQSTLEPFGVTSSGALTAEIQAMIETAAKPGPFLVFTHSDPCPDNVFDLGERFCLIDFEFSQYGHALRDAIYPRMVWPSCWCANRLPGQMIARMEKQYRAELVLGCPQASEDSVWESALADMCGLALLYTLTFELAEADTENHEWGLATIQQRVLARLDAFVTAAEEFRRLPALRGTASQLLPILQKRWLDTPALPLYPAFAHPA